MDLVIVESPTKAKTLSQFLGKDYEVMASMGHVVDLPKSQLGVDVEHDFTPAYTPSPKSKSVIKSLRAAAQKASAVWLSTDPDREGEAIAWHIAQTLSANGKLTMDNGQKKPSRKSQISNAKSQMFKRAVFHEITKEAVEEAFHHPRDLDMNLVNSQQARRILDRLVGYKLSPLLWKKVRYGLSAGRVQSVAVRLIVERERERRAFKPTEYWTIETEMKGQSGQSFRLLLSEINGQKPVIPSEKEASATVIQLRRGQFAVAAVKTEEKKKHPFAPFTTSTLQQTAGNRFSFSAARVMKAAQSLYERGLITYMRTDSTHLASSALSQIRAYIYSEFGPDYLSESARVFKTKSRLAQEAHEAIRPTRVELRSKNSELSGDEEKIYELIWQRSVACQMKEAVFAVTTVEILGQSSQTAFGLRGNGSVPVFDGWLKVTPNFSEGEVSSDLLPKLTGGESLELVDVYPSQHFTEPPPRYTEATLIKTLEELGIGRPSTYAPTISTIVSRGYVTKDGRALFPQPVGEVVNDLLVTHFPEIVDFDFTAKMEGDLDEIAEGKKDWVPIIQCFYAPFEQLIEKKEKEIKKEEVTTLARTEEKCPQCGRPLVVKLGKFGKFLSCTGFPGCKFAKPVEGESGIGNQGSGLTPGVDGLDSGSRFVVDESQLGKCPKDQGDLVIKRGRFGQFVACGNYPECKFTKVYLEKIGVKCPDCGDGEVILKKSGKGRSFFGCSRYPECKFASWTRPGTKTKL